MAIVKFTYKQDPDTVFKFLSDPATVRARSEAFGEALPEEGGLAASAHADHGETLALDAGQMDISARVSRHRGSERVDDLLTDKLLQMSFHGGRYIEDMSF